MSPRASVLIPCHDKHHTLPLAVDSVLRQSVPELEVLLVGDGVTAAVRATARDLVAHDPRVRFLDLPKGPHHGEVHRHTAILAAEADAIFYLCDDDLLLRDHVADLLALLEDATFVQCRNGYVRPDGSARPYPADLADPFSLGTILTDQYTYNAVSITGTAHSREFYLAAGAFWETTPPGVWPDHHQWRRMACHPLFRGATSRRMTVVQLPTSSGGRDSWSEEERLAELRHWHDVVVGPEAQQLVDSLYLDGAVAWLCELAPRLEHDAVRIHRLRRQVRRLRRRVRRLRSTLVR